MCIRDRDIIAPALLRPGRFDKLIYVPPPDKRGRLEIFKVHTRKMPLAEDVSLEELAEKTDGYTGADIAAVCNTAAMLAIREHLGKYPKPEDASKHAKELKVYMKHFKKALEKVKPMPKEELEMYTRIAEKFRASKGTA